MRPNNFDRFDWDVTRRVALHIFLFFLCLETKGDVAPLSQEGITSARTPVA